MALIWPSKEADEVLDYVVDWSGRLGVGDTVASSIVAIQAGAVHINSQGHTTTTSFATISGGTSGETAVIEITVTTSQGFVLEATAVLPVAQQEATYQSEVQPVYQTAEDIDRYMVGAFGDYAQAWAAATPTTKQAAAVAATRLIERQIWQGAPTGLSGQVLQWPRTGLVYPGGGGPVPPNVIPLQLLDAVCEIAAQLVNGSNLQDVSSTYDNTRLLKAGSVEIENFRALPNSATRFPQVIQELVGFWLGGSSGPLGSLSSGVCGRTIFNEEYNFTRGI